jgi:hypothetical protein
MLSMNHEFVGCGGACVVEATAVVDLITNERQTAADATNRVDCCMA